MAVTDAAIGADQVWAGLEGLAGLTGRGVGIAIVDSGIARHPAIRDRIVATVDFTAARGRGRRRVRPRDARGGHHGAAPIRRLRGDRALPRAWRPART